LDRVPEPVSPATEAPHGRLDVDLPVFGDGVGGGDSEDESDVPSSEDLRPLSPNLCPAGEGDSFLDDVPLLGL